MTREKFASLDRYAKYFIKACILFIPRNLEAMDIEVLTKRTCFESWLKRSVLDEGSP